MQISELFSAPKAEQANHQPVAATQKGGFKSTFLQQWKAQTQDEPLAQRTARAATPAKSQTASAQQTPIQQPGPPATESKTSETPVVDSVEANEIATPTQNQAAQAQPAPTDQTVATSPQQTQVLPDAFAAASNPVQTNDSELLTVQKTLVSSQTVSSQIPSSPQELELDDLGHQLNGPQTQAPEPTPPVLSWEDWNRIQDPNLSANVFNPELTQATDEQDKSQTSEQTTAESVQSETALNWVFASPNLTGDQVQTPFQFNLNLDAETQQAELEDKQAKLNLRSVFLEQALQTKPEIFGSKTSQAPTTGLNTPLNQVKFQVLANFQQLENAVLPNQASNPVQSLTQLNPTLLQHLVSLQSSDQPFSTTAPTTEQSLSLGQSVLGYSSTGQATLEAPQVIQQPGAAASALAERFELMQQLSERIQMLHSSARREIELQLKPAHLGKITIQLQQEAQHFNLQILTESPLTKNLIEAHLQQLKDQFAQQGFDLQHVQVDVHSQSQFNQEAHSGSPDTTQSQSQDLFQLGESPESNENENENPTESTATSTALINTLA